MPSQPPLPPLLAPYVSSLPDSSLTVVSSILGATSNWLVLRFLYAALSSQSVSTFGTDELHNGTKKKVVLVSFVRSYEFWKAEAKRLVSTVYRIRVSHLNMCLHICIQSYILWLLKTTEALTIFPGPWSHTSRRKTRIYIHRWLIWIVLWPPGCSHSHKLTRWPGKQSTHNIAYAIPTRRLAWKSTTANGAGSYAKN